MKNAFQFSGKKIGSLLLVICMMLTLLPVAALAASDITGSFTDAKFLAAVRTALGKDVSDPIYDTDVAPVTILNVSGESIESLAGIAHFTALTTLNCSLNWLEELPAELPAGLTNLDCSNNSLTALTALPTGLQHLDCGENDLTALTALPTNLTYLRCSGNELTALTALPSGLTDLNCSNNRLTALDLSGLGSLAYCNANSQNVSLTLMGSGTSYTTAIALNNPTDLTSGLSYAGGVLTSNSAAITTSSFTVATGKTGHQLSGTLNLTYQTDGIPLTFSNSAAYNIPASTVNSAITNINAALGVSGGTTPYTFSATGLPAGITISSAGVISGTPTTAADAGTATITVTDSAAPTATKSITINYGAVSAEPAGTDITGSFTDTNFLAEVRTAVGKGVSESVYDIDVASVTSLNVSNKDITSLAGIEYFTALNELNCNNNQLMALDVSSNTALTHLYCYSNHLTALDVRSNTALIDLYCYNNQLTALDVRSNTALTHLYCNNNQLTALDVSSNTALIDLYCDNNQLTALDVRSNTALIDLYCDNNQLTALDVSSNTALTHLYCDNNQLTALDVHSNTALTSLDCYSNHLTALDVRSNTALIDLYCYNNQLTALDVHSNTALTSLVCSNNQLTALDVSSNTALIDLVCSSNQLTALDVSGLALLQICEANNQTVSLTLTGNGSSYTKTIALNNPTNLDPGLSYAGGVLTSNSTAITTSSFTVDTGSADYELSGTLNLTYPTGTNITLNANGGNALTPGTLTTGTDGRLTALPTPTRSDYRFDGWFTAKNGGTKVTTETVFTVNTTIYAHWTYTPWYPVSGVTLNKSSLTLEVNGPAQKLAATVQPSYASNRYVYWNSSDTAVARVDNTGLVTPVAPGQAIITATTAEGGKTASCTVTVITTITATAEETIVLHDVPLNINVPPEVEATIEVTPGSTMPQVNINNSTALGTVEIQIPEGTIASGPDGWDGTFKLPTISNQPSVNINGASQVNTVIVLGLEDEQISFSQAVRILIPGQAQQQVGYIRNGVFTPITRILSADRQDVADSEIPADGDGKIDVDSDLVVWTKHFTEFVIYTPISNPKPASYTVSLSSNYAKAGTVSGDGVFYGGSLITVRANVQSGYVFDYWSENGSMLSPNSVYSFNLGESSRQLQANFVREFQELSITDATKPRITTFSHPVLPDEQNLGNIYVATDINGDNKVEGVIVAGVPGNNCQISVKPPDGQWLAGASYYLILEPGLQSALNKTLGIRTRMKFTVE